MKFKVRIQFLWDVTFRLWLIVVGCDPIATGLLLFLLKPLILNKKALHSFHKCNQPVDEADQIQTSGVEVKRKSTYIFPPRQ